MMAWSYQPQPTLTESQFARWQCLLEQRTGIDLSQHRAILQAGLRQRLRQRCPAPEGAGIDYDAYYEEISQLPQGLPEWQCLIDCVTVKETRFFRQPAAYDLVRSFLQRRIASPHCGGSLDLWSAGCATGEEAYSLAIVACEAGGGSQLGVFATDISAGALQQVRAACYPARRVAPVPEPLRSRYFQRVEAQPRVDAAPAEPPADGPQPEGLSAGSPADSEAHYQVVPGLRQRVCCSQANLLQPQQLPPLPMDVIFCQNVLVYFRRWRVRQVLDALVQRLKPGGLLVVGPGEAAHWQHPAMVATAHQGVSAYLRRLAQ